MLMVSKVLSIDAMISAPKIHWGRPAIQGTGIRVMDIVKSNTYRVMRNATCHIAASSFRQHPVQLFLKGIECVDDDFFNVLRGPADQAVPYLAHRPL